MVAAIGEQILGPTDVSLSNWTVRFSSGCSVVLHTGVSVDGYTLTLAANPWNIVRTYNLTPGRELLFACRYRLVTASNFVVHMSEADNVYDPLYGSFVGDQGAWSTAKMYFTVPPNGVAKLHFQAPGLPNQSWNRGRLRPPRRRWRRTRWEPTLTTLACALQQPELHGLGQLHGARLPAGGLRHDPERLRLEHRAHLHADAGETLLLRLPVPAGHGLQLGDVRQRGRQRLRGRYRHLPRHALAGCLEHGAPGLLGAAGRNREAALGAFGGSIPGLAQQSAGSHMVFSARSRCIWCHLPRSALTNVQVPEDDKSGANDKDLAASALDTVDTDLGSMSASRAHCKPPSNRFGTTSSRKMQRHTSESASV